MTTLAESVFGKPVEDVTREQFDHEWGVAMGPMKPNMAFLFWEDEPR